jgi:hypothetical protein
MIPEPVLSPGSLAHLEVGITSFQMRRVLSLMLAIAFGLGPLAFAIGYDDGASLPACCRRHGAHHCAMAVQSDSGNEQTVEFTAPSHCPLFPAHQNATPTSLSALVRWPFAVSVKVDPAPAGAVSVSANGAGNLCTFRLRGPPSTLISA